MGKPKALLLGKLDHAQDAWNAIGEIAELTTTEASNRGEFLEELRSGKHDGVVAICDRAPPSIAQTGKWDEELLDALPESVKFIAHMGAGYDSLDIAACSARGIFVSNCPRVVEEATADCAIFLILATLRGFNNGIMAIRNGTWKGAVPPPPLGHDPQGKVLGILGLGGIGLNLKRKAEVFGLKVIYHNRNKLDDDMAEGAEYVNFDDLLAKSDVLSLNLPLNPKTRNLISTKEFAKMKEGIMIVNTARGGVLDEDALVDALNSGRVLSVGLDVYQQEPNIHPGLVSNPHVCLLPHLGTSTVETKTRMEEWTIGNVRSALESGRLKSTVSEQVHLLASSPQT
ncbi:glyoxylate reductase [Elasticomyces elasticus]|uniref:Glyoxylate reductase n=1 Tax=Exophiala sideris TaxID=1016849 RepID=A0ABR0JKE7_9EURO|nr:glyoxylate reductase [Elasticomyces elasticus]KAK5035472.1 glyoxylate reductase [Exophiala sideris]KAK5039177.1 glyoxylate reductase [Exophiala sideris]KAK5066397.1 glyoxylate reductase [Exophiala sideris]KAK5187074.1 glyoxylate reductase [Eurotiomycetes sp. CCFEE 6388]